jgi:hypothetical protein
MTDTTDDIAEEISFQSFDDDCRLLGNLLNDILHREVGTTFVDKLERIRVLAQVTNFFLKTQTFHFFFIPHFFYFSWGFIVFNIHYFYVIFALFPFMGFCFFPLLNVKIYEALTQTPDTPLIRSE